jgi:hypothetical protein
MGGRALRRKRKIIAIWSIIAGLLVAAILALCMYMLNGGLNHP